MTEIARAFAASFGGDPAAIASAPGRVNLIGEHIDYAGGLVLPAVIPRRLTVAFRPAPDDVHVRSTRFDSVARFPLDAPFDGSWSDYVRAAHRKAVDEGLASGGAQYLIDSDIPDGAGVSSSAALIVAVLRAHLHAAGVTVEGTQVAKWAREVETDHIGVPCGVMDQMAVAIGREGHALALDTADLSFDHVPLPPDGAFIVFHSGLKRQLAEGRYKERFEAVSAATARAGVEWLAQADDAALLQVKSLGDAVYRRARHVVSEHRRSMLAVGALRAGDLNVFGRLMNDSHASMRDDFEIVPPAMDAMATAALEAGAFGARLTGGGFGGCFVVCIRKDAAADLSGALCAAFLEVREIARIG